MTHIVAVSLDEYFSARGFLLLLLLLRGRRVSRFGGDDADGVLLVRGLWMHLHDARRTFVSVRFSGC